MGIFVGSQRNEYLSPIVILRLSRVMLEYWYLGLKL